MIQVPMFRQQLLDTSRGRIVSLLRGGPLTADELAKELKVTASGVRALVTAMERDGVVRRVGSRPGTTRPARLFELTPDTEQLLSGAYLPLLTQLVDVFTRGLPAEQLDGLLRETGRQLGRQLTPGNRRASLAARVQGASRLLNEKLGAVTRVEENGKFLIRGNGCPLSAVTGKHAAVCRAMESLVETLVGAPAHECCERNGRPLCCFEIAKPVAGPP
jgi:predicted ArsR family transcriptional regulator